MFRARLVVSKLSKLLVFYVELGDLRNYFFWGEEKEQTAGGEMEQRSERKSVGLA